MSTFEDGLNAGMRAQSEQEQLNKENIHTTAVCTVYHYNCLSHLKSACYERENNDDEKHRRYHH